MTEPRGKPQPLEGAVEVAKVSSSMARGVGVTVAVIVALLTAMAFLYLRLTERERRNVLSARESSAIALADLFSENARAPIDFRDEESARKAAETLRTNPSVLASAIYLRDAELPFAAYHQGTASLPPAQAPGTVAWIPASDPNLLRVSRTVAAELAGNPSLGCVVVDFSLEQENKAFAEGRRTLLALSLGMAAGLFVVLGVILRVSHAAAEASRRATEKALLDQEFANDELKRLDKLKDEFLANTSHELRTPLHGILGLTEAVLRREGDDLDHASREHLEMALASGRRLASLVNDILDFSKLRHQKLTLRNKVIDVRAAVDLVLTVTLPLAQPKGLTLRNDVGRDVLVLADESRLQQILTNLVGNAVKFTPSGAIALSARVEGDRVVLSVKDSGIGIPKDAQERIFESFQQGDGSTAREFGGTGLGLAVTRQLVGLHGGCVSVESTPGQGSTFAFDLPAASDDAVADGTGSVLMLAAEASKQIALSAAPSRSSDLSSKPRAPYRGKLLVADDDPVNIEVLRAQLDPEGYVLVVARDGQQAIDAFYKEGPFDGLLLDVMMPKLTGPQVAERIRKEYPAGALPIVMLTAKSRPEDAVIGMRAGANDYLSKPFHREELLTRLAVHIDAARTLRAVERFMSPALARLVGAAHPSMLQLGQGSGRTLGLVRVAIRGLAEMSARLDEATLFSRLGEIVRILASTFEEHGAIVEAIVDDEFCVLVEAPSYEMLKAARKALTRVEPHMSRHLHVSVALHSGHVKLGVLGDDHWVTVRTVGESVLTVGALGRWAVARGFDIILTDSLLSKLEGRPLVRRLGTARLGAEGHPVTVFESVDANDTRVNLDELVDAVEAGRHAEVEAALVNLDAHDPLVILLAEQCAQGQTELRVHAF